MSELEGKLRSYRFFSKSEIERCANKILQQVPAKKQSNWSLNVNSVSDFLEIHVCYHIIPPDEEGPIVAKILHQERAIIINEDVAGFHKKIDSSTIAHEIGHWVLHVNQHEIETLSKQRKISENSENNGNIFLCRLASEQLDRYSLNNQENRLEWQAQYFASCLLMPHCVLEEKRKMRDLTKWSHLYAIRDELGVTLSHLIARLQDLDWIYIPNGSRQIYQGKG
ncbi:MAG: ImmA/IrrE family metallo-endopeptidase [Oscillatoriaceae cyanobacterium Prado104]|nr:ImmA/IrrE family metallo-endopeptidase [Oscillatoriaceae cyanobacterium Prado104]